MKNCGVSAPSRRHNSVFFFYIYMHLRYKLHTIIIFLASGNSTALTICTRMQNVLLFKYLRWPKFENFRLFILFLRTFFYLRLVVVYRCAMPFLVSCVLFCFFCFTSYFSLLVLGSHICWTPIDKYCVIQSNAGVSCVLFDDRLMCVYCWSAFVVVVVVDNAGVAAVTWKSIYFCSYTNSCFVDAWPCTPKTFEYCFSNNISQHSPDLQKIHRFHLLLVWFIHSRLCRSIRKLRPQQFLWYVKTLSD